MQISKFKFIVAFSIVAACLLTACNPFEKQTFEACLLEHLKGVTSDDAAADIKMACAIKTSKKVEDKKLPVKKCENRPLTLEERRLVNGRAWVESYGFMKVKIYNGNSDIKINGIKVKLIDKTDNKEFDFDLSIYKVAPQTTSEEMLAELLYAPKKWDWDIYGLTTEVCK
jgi:hypothetical protein